MGQGNCGRIAAASAMVLLGLPPAFAMDRVATYLQAGGSRDAPGATLLADSDWAGAARPCPTRFDYLVLASFTDAQSLLSLSTYHFRSEVGFSTIPLSGLLRVDYNVESGAGSGPGDCRARDPRRQTG
jgi:hypothetical protein